MVHCNISVQKIQPQAFDAFFGIDVDKRSIVGLIVDHDGVEKSVRMPYEVTHVLHYLKHYLPNKRVILVYEAGPKIRLLDCDRGRGMQIGHADSLRVTRTTRLSAQTEGPVSTIRTHNFS